MNIEVELSDFDRNEIREFARDNLDMENSISDIDTDHLLEELRYRGASVNENFYYPNNSIIDADLVSRFIEGYSDIDKKELEQFLNKFNL